MCVIGVRVSARIRVRERSRVCVCGVTVRAPVLMFSFLLLIFFINCRLFPLFFHRPTPVCAFTHIPVAPLHSCPLPKFAAHPLHRVRPHSTLLVPAFSSDSPVCLQLGPSRTRILIAVWLWSPRPPHPAVLLAGEVAFNANSRLLSQFIGLLARWLGVRWIVVESGLRSRALPRIFDFLVPHAMLDDRP